jgi:6-phosphogluconolactonase
MESIMNNQHLIFVTSCAAGDAGAINAFNLDTETGALEQINRYADIEGPFFIALSPDRRYLYSTHAPGNLGSDSSYVAAFEIVGTSGELRRINEQPTNGQTACYVDVSPNGKAAVIANYSSGSVASYPIGTDGSLGEMASFVQHEGGSMVNPARQEAAHAHCSVISPSGNHMFACDLGLDQILGYALDEVSAQLTPLDQPYIRTIGGGGPRHFTYHPQGGYVYANNELANSVNVYRYDENTGMLVEQQVIPSLPDDFDAESFTADVKITPDGRHLYCSNRRHDSIAIYRIGKDGGLSLVDIQPAIGNFAQNLAITPDGRLLLCANMQAEDADKSGENVVVFRIDEGSGKLSMAQEPIKVANPSCIMIV